MPLFDEMDSGRGDHLIAVVHELRHSLLQAARRVLRMRWARLTFSSIGQSSMIGMTFLRIAPPTQVVHVLDRGRTLAAVSVLDRIARGDDVLPWIDQAQQAVNAIDRAVELVVERAHEQRLLRIGVRSGRG